MAGSNEASSMEGGMSFKSEISSPSRARSASCRGKTSFEGEARPASRARSASSQDQCRVEHEARLELLLSLLEGGIAASLVITRTVPGTPASEV